MMFALPPEAAHSISMKICAVMVKFGLLGFFFPGIRSLAGRNGLSRQLWGLSFRNPVGLGAGFDKNAEYLKVLDHLGFGFVEIGTVTPVAQAGNEKPRLFRLPKDYALINRMGFNNMGVDAVAANLEKWRAGQRNKPTGRKMLVGGNIGKNKPTPNDDAWKDYRTCYDKLFDHVDFFIVNVSSPNTPGLRALQGTEALRAILSKLVDANAEKPEPKPLLVKIAPDLEKDQAEEIVRLALELGLHGIVATNTTVTREGLLTARKRIDSIGMGGLSGKPVANMSGQLLDTLVKCSEGKLPIISSGGIFTAEDATERLRKGASLVEVWTGFVYKGPGLVRNICRGIAKGID